MSNCRATGCNEASHGYSPYCQNHRKTQRRHGAATQTGVTVHELKPYVALVEARKAKNANSEAWSILTARWMAVLDHAQATLRRHSEGHAGSRSQLLAAHHLVTVGEAVEPWAVVRTALALYLMQDQRPSRFASDAAFDFQLVRRVRGLAEVNAGVTWDHQAQRTKKVYREVPPRVMQAMAEPLKVAFGMPGLTLAAKEREDVNRANEERRRLSNALEGLV
ncbi:MAG: hypothetical protein EKK45_01865 [Curvibacter sp.]|nr:MAG: hypothetical protein EKK45_01865 [Curvibacter sp.]